MRVDEISTGRRVAYWRKRRHLSQQVFADRLGRSTSWVEKIEGGQRRLDRLSVLHEIAEALRIDVQLLLGDGPPRRTGALDCIDRVDAETIRAAMECGGLPAFALSADPPPISEVRKSVRHAWLTFQHGRYGVLVRALPTLLRDAQVADTTYRIADARAREAAHLVGQVYQVTAAVLRKLGEHDLAWLAADRAVAAAQRAADNLLAGTATGQAGAVLVAMDRPRPALAAQIAVATRLAPDTGHHAHPEQISVYGHLLLHSAMSAAHLHDQPTTRELISRAEAVADQLGSDQNHYWTSFGPTNVRLHQAAALVVLGQPDRAVEVGRQIPADVLCALPAERRANHHLTLALAHAQLGAMTEAGTCLVDGDRLAPGEIRHRPVARDVLRDVLRGLPGTPPPPVAALATNLGVGL
ncbi:helix-turn-helix domain-containing protein [Micromonospora sp. NPDC003197]